MSAAPGERLPRIDVPPPGPESRRLAAELARYESPNITFVSDDAPIFWREAVGANVIDVDGNRYVDLTAGFAAASTGHRNPRVLAAVEEQLRRLGHGFGDVHPPEIKVRLLERLARIAPGALDRTILATAGSEAVEAALKTARLATGRSGVLCFTGAYHGLTYGALAPTDREHFRAPFADQLGIPVVRVPFPDPYRPHPDLEGAEDIAARALDLIRARLSGPEGALIGGVIVEPIQGRGGVVVPPPDFLPGLRDLCDKHGLVLIVDEILTGLGRTGRWFACEHQGVEPDLLCVGKALTGLLPFSACIGRAEIMAAWPPSGGEAIHTTTFLGHPLGCAAALAQIEEIEERELVDRAARLGDELIDRLRELSSRFPVVGDVRGRGLLVGLDIVGGSTAREPDADRTRAIVAEALRRGVILLPAGPYGNVLSLTPPLTITAEQLEFAVSAIEDCLAVV